MMPVMVTFLPTGAWAHSIPVPKESHHDHHRDQIGAGIDRRRAVPRAAVRDRGPGPDSRVRRGDIHRDGRRHRSGGGGGTGLGTAGRSNDSVIQDERERHGELGLHGRAPKRDLRHHRNQQVLHGQCGQRYQGRAQQERDAGLRDAFHRSDGGNAVDHDREPRGRRSNANPGRERRRRDRGQCARLHRDAVGGERLYGDGELRDVV